MEEVSGIDLFLVLNAPHNIELIVCLLNILNVRSGDELVLTGGREQPHPIPRGIRASVSPGWAV